MNLKNLLNVTHPDQKIRIYDSVKVHPIFEGRAVEAPSPDRNVVAIYADGDTVVLGVL